MTFIYLEYLDERKIAKALENKKNLTTINTYIYIQVSQLSYRANKRTEKKKSLVKSLNEFKHNKIKKNLILFLFFLIMIIINSNLIFKAKV